MSRDLSRYYIRKKEKKGNVKTIDRARKTGRKKDYTSVEGAQKKRKNQTRILRKKKDLVSRDLLKYYIRKREKKGDN